MNDTSTTIGIIVVLLLLVAGGAYAAWHYWPSPLSSGNTATTTDGTSTTTPGGDGTGGTAGAHCGGFIQNAPTCAAGYHCQLTVSRPDTGGVCVADDPMAADSGIHGSVLLGPTCPVQREPPDPACADKPYATAIFVHHTGSASVIATIPSAADGTFSVSLPPGSYTLTAGSSTTLPRCTSVDVTVAAHAYATTQMSCDTGIR